jgi:hypothetical protein
MIFRVSWQDDINFTNAGYAISCAIGDCSGVVLDTVAQQVTLDVALTNVIGLATAPLTVNGTLDY